MLLLISSVKLIAEIALLSLLGQWILGLLAGQKREQNLFYQVLQVLTRPFVRATRFITPRFVQIPVTTVRMTTYLPTQRVAPSLLETNKEMMDYPSFVVMILTVVAV